MYASNSLWNVFVVSFRCKKSISDTTRNVVNRNHFMTTMRKNHSPVQGPSGIGKTSVVKKEKPGGAKGFFGLLSDWKIDTQELKDELRD